MRKGNPSEGFRRGETSIFKVFQFKLFKDLLTVTTFDFFRQVKIEVFQLVKHEVLSDGEGFQETEGLEEEEDEEAGILNSEQEWL